MLTVTNRNNFDFTGRFDGTDYNFPAKATVAVPDDAARHIFGVGVADKTDTLVRHGWMTHSGARDQALQILNGFAFGVANELTAGEIIEVEAEVVDTPADEQGSAPLQNDAGGEADSSESAEAPVVTSKPAWGGSILDRLSGS